jgi:hypothetical protein
LQLIFFAVTLFVSAFLLFLVQPMIGKMILPRLGGTPQVWNTCMMFFQTVLLAGYAYTHNMTSKLPVRRQLIVHSAALLLPILVLFVPAMLYGRPLYVGQFGAEGGGNPIFMTLMLLALIIGIPFLVVSATAPLLQRWFASTGHPAARDPYFLYGASNAGSIIGLLLYPALVESFLGLEAQAWVWSIGYVVLACLVGGCAFMVLKAPLTVQLPGMATEEPPPAMMPEAVAPSAPAPPKAPTTAVTATPPQTVPRQTGIKRGGKQRGGRGGRGGALPQRMPAAAAPAAAAKITHAPVPTAPPKPFEMTPLRRLRWVGLAAVPSSLMLGVSTYISTDISPVPLLWVIPLTLYLLSFVFVFARWPVVWGGNGNGDPRSGAIAGGIVGILCGIGIWFAVGSSVGIVVTILIGVGLACVVGTGVVMGPHKVCLFLQPIAIALVMLVFMTGGYSQPLMAMAVCWGSFFVTALVCHGELAADRPPARFLTEFYLWMSVGGMLGGTFNALFAPLIPWFGLFEFPLAVVLSGVLRPSFKGEGWTDTLLGAYQSPSGESISMALDLVLPVVILAVSYFIVTHSLDPESWSWHSRFMDNPKHYPPGEWDAVAKGNSEVNPLFKFANRTLGMSAPMAYSTASVLFLILTYGVMMGCAMAGWKRPLRMALGLGGVLLANSLYEYSNERDVKDRDRSYFGILRVIEEVGKSRPDPKTKERTIFYRATTLMHGTTHHGLNYQEPKELNRLATTYYHRYGPVGTVMEKLNWFPGVALDKAAPDAKLADNPSISYWSDARLPASVVASGVPNFGVGLPLAQLASVWSEPPLATIGLGTGTMASYGRPYQHVVFYEIDKHIRNFSIPPSEDREAYFSYLQGAMKRGCKLEVIMGDARLTMTKEQKDKEGEEFTYLPKFPLTKGAKLVTLGPSFASYPKRESYYRAMEVDAFSSDAIPVHLITKEAIEMYMDKLVPNGVLLVHTSNRHVNLVKPVLRICDVAEWKDWLDRNADGTPKVKTGLAWVICKDDAKKGFSLAEPAANGHFGSEYVLVARKQEYLPPFEWTDQQIKVFKEHGLKPVVFSKEQMKYFEQEKLPYFESSIKFYSQASIAKDDEAQRIVRIYDYIPPPTMRVWTDDYSNILSVFRW